MKIVRTIRRNACGLVLAAVVLSGALGGCFLSGHSRGTTERIHSEDRTYSIRLEVRDADTDLPVRGVQVRIKDGVRSYTFQERTDAEGRVLFVKNYLSRRPGRTQKGFPRQFQIEFSHSSYKQLRLIAPDERFRIDKSENRIAKRHYVKLTPGRGSEIRKLTAGD